MDTNFSPAPWAIEPLEWNEGGSICITGGAEIIAVIPPMNEDDNPYWQTAQRHPHDLHNAALLAAAPQLFQALTQALHYLEGAHTADEKFLTHCRHLLRQATRPVAIEIPPYMYR